MVGHVLWVIDSELDGRSFERLCIDLLYRNGYKDIVPVEPQDGGRDAEEFPRRGRSREGCAAFFQFSLEQDWKGKLRRDARKLSDRRSEFSTLVFVTSQSARGVDIDALKTQLRKEYGWTLIVYAREWLRLQLEEAQPDLAKKYLGIDVPSARSRVGIIVLAGSNDERSAAVRARINAGIYDEGTIADLKAVLKDEPESYSAWQALAWCNYCVHRLDEALSNINKALKLKEDTQSRNIRACILTEKGISQHNKASVTEGLRLFEELLSESKTHTWHIFYNLGNALGALGKHHDAIARYKQALELEKKVPDIWKNLGSAYHLVGDHSAEMECFDRVLELDPIKPEALVSKGIALITDVNKPDEAVPLLETAFKTNPDIAIQWPLMWYWLGIAHQESGNPQQALSWVNNGLSHRPGDRGLRRLKSEILESLLSSGTDFAEEARRFWETEIREQPLDYESRRRLVTLAANRGNLTAAWKVLDDCFALVELQPAISLRTSGFTINDCVPALAYLPQYARYRARCPLLDYWNTKDSLYDLPFVPPMSDGIQAALSAFLSIPFGLASRYMEQLSDDRDSKASVTRFFEILREGIEDALSESAREFAALIPSAEAERETVAHRLTEVMMFLGLISIREFARQRAWIGAQFGLSLEAIDHSMDDYDESLIEKTVMSKSLVRLNKDLAIFPHDE
jgi:tetratricopeptide (TPR) repeat protein